MNYYKNNIKKKKKREILGKFNPFPESLIKLFRLTINEAN